MHYEEVEIKKYTESLIMVELGEKTNRNGIGQKWQKCLAQCPSHTHILLVCLFDNYFSSSVLENKELPSLSLVLCSET